MKKFFILILFIFPLICFASFNLNQWPYYKDINLSENKLTRFSIDDEIFTYANVNLMDLRIVDDNNSEIPYKMIIGKDAEKAEKFYPIMLNNSFVLGQNSSVIVDFNEKGKLINQMKIITDSENFQRNVIIKGADDMINWNILNDTAYIYDYTDKKAGVKSQNTLVKFPQSVYQYYKIEISDPEQNPVKINRVEAINYSIEKLKEVSRRPEFTINHNTEEKYSELIINLSARGIPTNKILFNIFDKNFNRSLLIYTSNDSNNWKYNSSGYIFRYNTEKFIGENLSVNFLETNDQYIKVIIQNKDNQPINIAGINIFSTYREIIFQSNNNKNYKIYYGNKKANLPEYDLEKYFQYLDLDNMQTATLSAQKKNSNYIPDKEPEKPLSERMPYLFPSALAIASLVLLFLVFKFFQKK